MAENLRGLGVRAFAFHSGLPAENRRDVHTEFQAVRRSVLVATSAYEMGVHNADVRTVVHYGLPSSMEFYVQGVGRAGRDGQPAKTVLWYWDTDLDILDSMEALSLRGKSDVGDQQLRLGAF